MRLSLLERTVRDRALRAMLYETAVHPKPGLVGPFDAGAHRDMTRFTFIDSAVALAPWMPLFVRAGFRRGAAAPGDLLPVVRRIGRRAERAMFRATGGVNTHKGLLFSFAILCAAVGLLASREEPASPERLSAVASGIVGGIVERELASLLVTPPSRPLTAGERLYLSHGLTGVRGEAELGFPTVVRHALPFLREALDSGRSPAEAGTDTLCVIMTRSDDTNVVHRAGIEGLEFMRATARKILAAGGMSTAEGRLLLAEAERAFMERDISPGGSADLLAVAFMLYFFV